MCPADFLLRSGEGTELGPCGPFNFKTSSFQMYCLYFTVASPLPQNHDFFFLRPQNHDWFQKLCFPIKIGFVLSLPFCLPARIDVTYIYGWAKNVPLSSEIYYCYWKWDNVHWKKVKRKHEEAYIFGSKYFWMQYSW